ncbi:hypothetical protein M407DRAFT_206060 [Tulasnella calospora MUT 4182]|uniref:Uncharacterized protein n=1 Tax=Tulasnella calospora MUT 4182 TaxID=1051891 RepID=A0A0C3QIR5_9AGAM|nr:hypothetical protein M407DRAFT_206060 [Tulasnella calospora MUT 4182]
MMQVDEWFLHPRSAGLWWESSRPAVIRWSKGSRRLGMRKRRQRRTGGRMKSDQRYGREFNSRVPRRPNTGGRKGTLTPWTGRRSWLVGNRPQRSELRRAVVWGSQHGGEGGGEKRGEERGPGLVG